jgi:hypothetical protein
MAGVDLSLSGLASGFDWKSFIDQIVDVERTPLDAQAAGLAQTFNGMSGTLAGVPQTRTWNDANGDKTILNADGSIQTNEVIGGTSNFGQLTSRPDPDLPRGYNWEYSAILQRELRPRLSVTAGYYRRDFYNLQVTDNQAVGVNDWTSYSINTPVDTRLALSRQPIPMFTLNTGKVGVATDNLVTFSTQNKTTYNGVEFTMNARGAKYLVFGGVTTDRRTSVTCDERDNPNGLRFCDSTLPAAGVGLAGVFRTTVKASAAYTFPYDIQASGSFASIPGPNVRANYTVTSLIAGRPIIGSTAGTASTDINLVEPSTMFLDRQNRLDLRLGKTFRLDRYKIQGFADVFNVFNAGTVIRVNETYAASGVNQWMTPTGILDGRYVRFGLQMSF